MGSSICSKFRQWRKTRAIPQGQQEDKDLMKNNQQSSQQEDEHKLDKAREIICQEDDEMKAFRYSAADIEELIADLEKQLRKARFNKPEKEKLLLDLGHAHYKLCKFQTAKDYYERYLSSVKGHHSLLHLQRAHCNLGCVYRRLGDYEKASDFLESGLAIAEELNDLKYQGRLLNNLGNICEMRKDFEGAIYYHSKRRKIAEILKDGDCDAKASASIANAYHCIGNLRKSIAYYERVVVWLQRKVAYQDQYSSRISLVSKLPLEDDQWV